MDVEVVCERGEEENLKKDAESRNVKLPPISRPLLVLQPALLGVFAYLSYLSLCASVSSHRQTFFFLMPRPKTKKVKLRKREKNRRRNKGLLLSHGTTRGDETPEHPRA